MSHLLWSLIIRSLRRKASLRTAEALNSKDLEAYLRSLRVHEFPLFLQDADSIKVSNIMRIGGGLMNDVYSFLLAYTERGEKNQIPLVIKTFSQNINPIFKSFLHDRELRTSIRVWEALRSLKRVGFAVPKALVCENDSRFLGYPFIIMEKIVRSQENSSKSLEYFAESLANLHNLEIGTLRLKVLKPPKDGYAYAKRWPIYFKHALNIETKHSKRLRRYFDFAISWLESNICETYCPKYSLIHGDYHPTNVMLTDDSKTIVVDWEGVDIGDPAFDVAYAYNMIKFFCNPKNPDSSEQIAKQFLSKYLQKSKVDIRPRFKFYQVVGILGYAIPYSSGLSSPVMAYKYHRGKVMKSIPFLKLPLILLAFPFLHQSFVARQIQAEGDLYWLNYFERFIENTFRKQK